MRLCSFLLSSSVVVYYDIHLSIHAKTWDSSSGFICECLDARVCSLKNTKHISCSKEL